MWIYMCMKECVLYWKSSSTLHGMIDIWAYKPRWLQSLLPGFIYFMYISSTTSVLYSTPLYMKRMSLGNKDYLIVVVIVKTKHSAAVIFHSIIRVNTVLFNCVAEYNP